jgi:hypothetical protein
MSMATSEVIMRGMRSASMVLVAPGAQASNVTA